MVNHFLVVENRYYHLFAKEKAWRHFRKPVIAFDFLVTSTYMIPIMINVPDQMKGKEFIYKVKIKF